MINTRLFHLLISLISAFALWMLLMFLAESTAGMGGLQRFFQIFGGSSGGYIQALTFFAFIFGLLQLFEKNKQIKKEYEGFNLNILPTTEDAHLTPSDVVSIKKDVIDLEKRGFRFFITDFVKKACTQYNNDHSVSETLHVLDSQIENSKNELESGLEMTRYLMNAIASLGFIGTVMGLSSAIANAHLAKTEAGMPEITKFMNVAFDTTLVALLLGLILSFFYHRYLEDMDAFYSKAKSYIIENLVSRINKSKA